VTLPLFVNTQMADGMRGQACSTSTTSRRPSGTKRPTKNSFFPVATRRRSLSWPSPNTELTTRVLTTLFVRRVYPPFPFLSTS
jgi:hypothetical protein